MNDAKRKENVAKEKGESGECRTNELAKKTPLLDNLKKGAVVTAAVALLGGCALKLDGQGPVDDGRTSDSTTRLDGTDRDTGEVEEDVPELEDAPDMDAEEDVDEDEVDVVGDAEEEDVTGDEELDVVEDEVSDAEEEDAATDVAEDEVSDVEEEEVTDAVEEDVADEEVTVICSPYDASRTMMMGVDATPMIVGGIGVVYRGPDTSGDALYDIYCGSTVVRSGINVASGGSRTVDVSEQGFRITLRPTSVTGWDTTVTATVDAY